jgi:hypothetical protein
MIVFSLPQESVKSNLEPVFTTAAHRLVKSFSAQTASQMLGIHKIFPALCSLLDGKIPVHTAARGAAPD